MARLNDAAGAAGRRLPHFLPSSLAVTRRSSRGWGRIGRRCELSRRVGLHATLNRRSLIGRWSLVIRSRLRLLTVRLRSRRRKPLRAIDGKWIDLRLLILAAGHQKQKQASGNEASHRKSFSGLGTHFPASCRENCLPPEIQSSHQPTHFG